MPRIVIATILVVVGLPALAFAQAAPSTTAEVVDAVTLGGSVLAGQLVALGLAAYRRRRRLLELDTWSEIAAVLAAVAPVALAVWVATPAELGPERRAAVVLIVAFGWALRQNAGPLGARP